MFTSRVKNCGVRATLSGVAVHQKDIREPLFTERKQWWRQETAL